MKTNTEQKLKVYRQKRNICETLLSLDLDFEYTNNDFALCAYSENKSKIQQLIQTLYNVCGAECYADYESDFGALNFTFSCYNDNVRVVLYTYDEHFYTTIINIIIDKLQRLIRF